MGGEKDVGELKPLLLCGGGEARQLGVVLPEGKKISLEARVEEAAAGL